MHHSVLNHLHIEKTILNKVDHTFHQLRNKIYIQSRYSLYRAGDRRLIEEQSSLLSPPQQRFKISNLRYFLSVKRNIFYDKIRVLYYTERFS